MWVLSVVIYKSGHEFPPTHTQACPVVWPCCSSHQEVESMSPLPASGLALWLAPNKRIKTCFTSSKPRPQENLQLRLACFSWESCGHCSMNELGLSCWMMATWAHGSVNPRPPANNQSSVSCMSEALKHQLPADTSELSWIQQKNRPADLSPHSWPL